MCDMQQRMDENLSHFDWNQARAFLATAEHGSLSRAAKVLHTTQPTVGRQVAALEDALGVALFERVGRGLTLTPSGAAVLDAMQPMAGAATRASLVAAGRNEQIAGRVAISVSDATAVYLMPGIIAELTERAPEVEVELIVTNSLSDLLRREADIALRHVRPREAELVARRLRDTMGYFYASPAFIRRYGHPRSVADAADMPFIGMARPEIMVSELAKYGIALRPENFRLFSETSVAGWEMARRGLGIGTMSESVAEQAPEMKRVLQDVPAIPIETWLTTHRELRMSKRIRVVFEFLAEALAR